MNLISWRDRKKWFPVFPLVNVQALGFPGGPVANNSPANAGNARDTCSIPGLGRSPGVGTGNPRKYSYLENSMDKEDWQATVPGLQRVRHDWAHTYRLYLCSPEHPAFHWWGPSGANVFRASNSTVVHIAFMTQEHQATTIPSHHVYLEYGQPSLTLFQNKLSS